MDPPRTSAAPAAALAPPARRAGEARESSVRASARDWTGARNLLLHRPDQAVQKQPPEEGGFKIRRAPERRVEDPPAAKRVRPGHGLALVATLDPAHHHDLRGLRHFGVLVQVRLELHFIA